MFYTPLQSRGSLLSSLIDYCKQGEDVIIVPAVSDEEAKEKYPDGWKSPKPYIRIVPQPQ